MKKYFLTMLGVAGLLTGAQAELNIGTVDMNKIFQSYGKTKEAEAKINEARETAKGEFDTRQEALKKLVEEVQKLQQEIQSQAASDSLKAQKTKARDEKVSEVRNQERELQEFRMTREKQLQDQALRMRNSIVEEINEIIQGIIKEKGYALVFDSTGPSVNGVPVVVYADSKFDFSEDVIKALNAKSGGTAKPAAE